MLLKIKTTLNRELFLETNDISLIGRANKGQRIGNLTMKEVGGKKSKLKANEEIESIEIVLEEDN